MCRDTTDEYRILTAADVPAYVAARPALAAHLGGTAAAWTVRDVADGNLNSVFLLDGPRGGLCVKQALPYVRVAGATWPMDVRRARYEAGYIRRVAPFVAPLAPTLHDFDEMQFVLVMEKLEPHVILRRAMIEGRHHPRVPADIARYVAAQAFFTSDLAAPFEAKAADQALFAQNLALQRISVDLIFTEPYCVSPRNRILPALEAWAAALRGDIALKDAVAEARRLYLTKAQSLLHGDLHSGSIMVTAEETRVIDGEFAWIGPSGFDIGNFLAHYAMSWFATPHHAVEPEKAMRFQSALAADMLAFWLEFEKLFLSFWQNSSDKNDLFPISHFADPLGQARLGQLRRAYVADLFADARRFMACKMIRRVLGFAQIADFLEITDETKRAEAAAGALALARSLLLYPERYPDIAAIVAALPCFAKAGLDPAPSRHI